MIVFNTFYMLVFGLLMIPCIDNENFLASFNIRMESYFLTMVLFTLLYQRSADVVIRCFIHWLERRNEYEADRYAVEVGFGEETSRAMIRNFSKNKDIIFVSSIDNFISSTHPPLLDRLDKIREATEVMK